MSQKKLLAILGSPHKNGATAKMLNCAIQSAQKSGWYVDTVVLSETQLTFCKGCHACMTTGECVIKDDIHSIAKLLKECDVVALAAPTYWANVPAIVKNMFDRLFGVAIKESDRFPIPQFSKSQKYLLFTACKTPFPFCVFSKQSTGAIHAMKEFFSYGGMKPLGTVTFANASDTAPLPSKIERRIESFWKQKEKN